MNVPVVRPGWPTSPPPAQQPGYQGWSGYTYPAAPPPLVSATGRLSHRHLLSGLAGGLAGLAVVLVVVSLLAKTPAATPCTGLTCGVQPPAGPPVEAGELYKNPHFGFTVRYGQILSQGVPPVVSTANGDLTLSYKDDAGDALGQLEITGLVPNGQTAEQIVEAEVNQIASGAQLKYVIPGSMIGYQPGFGAAYNFTPDSGDGQTGVYRIIVLAAIHNGLAIVSLADGPLVVFGTGKGQFNTDFSSIADTFAALLGDPVLNTVLWPGQTFP